MGNLTSWSSSAGKSSCAKEKGVTVVVTCRWLRYSSMISISRVLQCDRSDSPSHDSNDIALINPFSTCMIGKCYQISTKLLKEQILSSHDRFQGQFADTSSPDPHLTGEALDNASSDSKREAWTKGSLARPFRDLWPRFCQRVVGA